MFRSVTQTTFAAWLATSMPVRQTSLLVLFSLLAAAPSLATRIAIDANVAVARDDAPQPPLATFAAAVTRVLSASGHRVVVPQQAAAARRTQARALRLGETYPEDLSALDADVLLHAEVTLAELGQLPKVGLVGVRGNATNWLVQIETGRVIGAFDVTCTGQDFSGALALTKAASQCGQASAEAASTALANAASTAQIGDIVFKSPANRQAVQTLREALLVHQGVLEVNVQQFSLVASKLEVKAVVPFSTLASHLSALGWQVEEQSDASLWVSGAGTTRPAATTATSPAPPVPTIDDLAVSPVFSSRAFVGASAWDIGAFNLVNHADVPLDDVQVTLTLPGGFQETVTMLGTVAARQRVRAALQVALSPELAARIDSDVQTVATASVRYRVGQQRLVTRRWVPLRVMDAEVIAMEAPTAVAHFVVPQSPQVQRLAHIVRQHAPTSTSAPVLAVLAEFVVNHSVRLKRSAVARNPAEAEVVRVKQADAVLVAGEGTAAERAVVLASVCEALGLSVALALVPNDVVVHVALSEQDVAQLALDPDAVRARGSVRFAPIEAVVGGVATRRAVVEPFVLAADQPRAPALASPVKNVVTVTGTDAALAAWTSRCRARAFARDEAVAALHDGNDAMLAGKFAAAVSAFERALAVAPFGHARVASNLAVAHIAAGDEAKARKQLRHAGQTGMWQQASSHEAEVAFVLDAKDPHRRQTLLWRSLSDDVNDAP